MISRRALLGALAAVPLVAREGAARAEAARPPALFVSHGSPLFMPGNDARRAELRAWGAAIPKPRGIVVVTPHFAARALALGAIGRGFAWYDLPGGMKRQLPQDLEYATPPNEALAARIDALLRPLPRDASRRGFDHTTWMPLRCMFPAADVPVIELAYPYVSPAEAFALGRRLAPLRDEGVLFVASGGMTHNLAAGVDASAPTPAYAREFDAWATERLGARDVDALIEFRAKAPGVEIAHPDDGAHYRVLLVALGIAGAGTATFPVTGFEGALSKRCVEIA